MAVGSGRVGPRWTASLDVASDIVLGPEVLAVAK